MTEEPAHPNVHASVGIVLVPDGFDERGQIGGLAPLLRHALAMQAAGVDAVVLLGHVNDVPEAERLKIPLLEAVPSHQLAIVTRADVTAHSKLAGGLRNVVKAGPNPVVYAGTEGVNVMCCVAARTEEVVAAARERRVPVDAHLEAFVGEGPFAEFVVRAGTPAERHAASERHLDALRKITGGYFEKLYMRPMSKPMTRVLCRTSITPNAMSTVTLLIALLAGWLVAGEPLWMGVAGGLLHIWMRVVDCVDGELARLKFLSSRFGEWYDTIGDGIGMAALIAGVTVHQARLDPSIVTVGAIGIVGWTLQMAFQTLGALRVGNTGTFHRVEWGHRRRDKNFIERFVAAIEMSLRIDAISTYYGIAIVFSAHGPLLYVHAIMSVVASIYFGVQWLALGGRATAARHAAAGSSGPAPEGNGTSA